MAAVLRKKFGWLFPAQWVTMTVVALAAFTVLPLIHYKNTKVFADEIQRLRRPGDRVVLFNRYYASLPFYLGARVLCVGLPKDMASFDLREISNKYFFPRKNAIRFFLNGPKRVFVLTDETGFDQAQSFTSVPLYPILKRQKAVLFSNRLQE